MKNTILAFCLFSLCACSNNQLVNQKIESAAQKKAAESNVSPEQAVNNARHSFAKANEDGLSFFTPLHLSDAQKSLTTIENLQQAEKDNTDTNHSLAIITESFKAIELINNAYKTKSLIQNTLTESLANKAVLEQLSAQAEFPNDYAEMLEELVDIFKLIENNKVEEARKEENQLIASMIKLETNTLIKRYINPAQLVLDRAEDNDADQYAETTFEQAEDSIKRGIAFIKSNYRQREAINDVAAQTLIAAQRANNIGKMSHEMIKLSAENAELKALEIENLFILINQGAQLPDIRGLTLFEQAKIFSDLAAAQKKKVSELEQALATEQHKNISPSN